MEKEEIIKAIKQVGTRNGRNSMGISESYYNDYYLIKTCFTIKELEAMSEKEIKSVVKLAVHATGVFY